MQKLSLRQIVLAMIGANALFLAGCGISQPGNVETLNRSLGDVLPGAQGLTLADQDRIDETVARGCAIGTWSPDRCDDHTAAAAARRAELSAETPNTGLTS